MKGSEDLRGLQMSLLVYLLVFAMKLAVYLTTGVMALFAEAMHTLSDIFISGFLLVATLWSRKEADDVHMFGHGRGQNVAALVAATLFISFTSLRLYEEALPRLARPGEGSYQNLPLAVGVIVASMFLAAAPLIGLARQQQRGAAARAQLMELINDELGLLAALVGTLLILGGHPIGDPAAAMVVATIIAINAAGLFRDNVSFLLGRSPGPEFLRAVRELAQSVPGVTGVHDLRGEYIGPDTVHMGMHIEVPRGIPIEEADRIAQEVHKEVHDAIGCMYCVIHVDPAEPQQAIGSETTSGMSTGGGRGSSAPAT